MVVFYMFLHLYIFLYVGLISEKRKPQIQITGSVLRYKPENDMKKEAKTGEGLALHFCLIYWV
jgi:hypothetical protein